jgi:hypothetical protein
MRAVCIIGDIVASRHIRNRAVIQRRLETALRLLNRHKRSNLVSPYTVTLGDEFQAVYSHSEKIFTDLWYLLYILYPIRTRFSIGCGPLRTSINRKRALGMDGPAFYAAREGIESLKDSDGLFRVESKSAKSLPSFVNLSLDLIAHLSSNWKRNRLFIFHRILVGDSVKAIARRSSLTATAVYKNIQVGGLTTVAATCREIEAAIADNLKTR